MKVSCCNCYTVCLYIHVACPAGAGWSWLSVSLLFSVFALISKELGITALAVCVSMDLLLFNKVTIATLSEYLLYRFQFITAN